MQQPVGNYLKQQQKPASWWQEISYTANNPRHPLNSELPNPFQLTRITRNALNANTQAFSVGRCNTSQYLRCFIPATTRLWNELPSCIVESQELQRFKIGVNTYLLSR